MVKSAGVSAFLTKPILPSEIVRIVEKIGGTAVVRMEVTASSDRVSCNPTNSAPTESLPVIDDCAVTELIGLMTKEEQIQFFSEFSDDSREYIAKLRSAHSATDVAPAKEAMHALAGAALIIGAPKLANVARRLERLDQGALLIDAKAHASELATVMEQTLIQIKAQYFP